MFRCDDDLDLHLIHIFRNPMQKFQIATSRHDVEFHECCGCHLDNVRFVHHRHDSLPARFFEEDCHDRRGVDDQWGSPCSS